MFYLDVLTSCGSWNAPVCLFQGGIRPKFQVSLSSTGFLGSNSPRFFHLSLIISFGGAERLHTIRAFRQVRLIDSTAVDSGILSETIERRRRGLAIGGCLGRAVRLGYLSSPFAIKLFSPFICENSRWIPVIVVGSTLLSVFTSVQPVRTLELIKSLMRQASCKFLANGMFGTVHELWLQLGLFPLTGRSRIIQNYVLLIMLIWHVHVLIYIFLLFLSVQNILKRIMLNMFPLFFSGLQTMTRGPKCGL